MKKITSIQPYVFQNFLIISLELEWLKLFKKIPTFEVILDDKNRLHLISEVIKR